MYVQAIVAVDKTLTAFLYRFRRPWLTLSMRCLTKLGSGVVCFPAYILCLALGQYPLSIIATTALLAEAILLPLIVVLRYQIRRERPAPYTARAWTPWNRHSFPSHHSARSCMLALILDSYHPAGLSIIFLMAFLVSFSRIYLQKHYLSDVIAGAFIGLFAGFWAHKLMCG